MYSPGAELMPVRIIDEKQCAVQKFADLPLISSTYGWVSSIYNLAKQSHPAIQTVCEMAETGVKNIASSVEPLLDIFEPQLAVANIAVCRNLDRLQYQFPVLQQTVNEFVGSIYTKLREAKIVDSMLEIGAEVAVDAVEVTLCSARSAVNAVREISVSQMMARSVDKMIFKSDGLIEHFLPITDEELLAIASLDQPKGSGAAPLEKQKEEPSYYTRLGSLSTKLCSRAYHHSLAKLRMVKLGAQQALFQLEQIFYLLKYTKEELDCKVHQGQEKLYQMWKEWYKGQPKQSQSTEASQAEMESHVLATSYSVAQKMQEVCQKILTNMQSLPEHLQRKIQQAECDLKELQAVLSSTTCFQDLPSGFLKETPEKISKARKAVHEVMEYIAKNTRMSWVDGPFCPVESSA
ncbi:perilipin-3-like [Crotalus tigris]|uniref:perilipin-3-like n=1 Tax=Crotalus tigris TaxID=88082 RepID=UPI00192F9333|nr:perilipin-3-like [Crotalus tigris]